MPDRFFRGNSPRSFPGLFGIFPTQSDQQHANRAFSAQLRRCSSTKEMDDEAYCSGNLQTEAVSSRETAHFDVPKSLDSGLGDPVAAELDPTISGKGTKPDQTCRIPELQTHLRSKKAVAPAQGQREAITPHSVVTPTTNLVNRMDMIDLAVARQSAAEREFDSGIDSGIFTSLPETDFSSLPEKTSPKEQLQSLTEAETTTEQMDTTDTTDKMAAATVTAPQPERSQMELPVGGHRGRSESPSVPPVGESVEVVTELMRPEGSTPKRSAGGSPLQEYGAKSPRLGNVIPASFGE